MLTLGFSGVARLYSIMQGDLRYRKIYLVTRLFLVNPAIKTVSVRGPGLSYPENQSEGDRNGLQRLSNRYVFV